MIPPSKRRSLFPRIVLSNLTTPCLDLPSPVWDHPPLSTLCFWILDLASQGDADTGGGHVPVVQGGEPELRDHQPDGSGRRAGHHRPAQRHQRRPQGYQGKAASRQRIGSQELACQVFPAYLGARRTPLYSLTPLAAFSRALRSASSLVAPSTTASWCTGWFSRRALRRAPVAPQGSRTPRSVFRNGHDGFVIGSLGCDGRVLCFSLLLPSSLWSSRISLFDGCSVP